MWRIASCLVGLIVVAGCTTPSPSPSAPAAAGTDTNVVAAVATPPATPVPAAPAPAAAPAAPAQATPPAATPAQPATAPAAPPVPPKETKIKHAAIGTTVTASSTNKKNAGELPASALVDGDLATRWSSEYTEPQTIEVKLEKSIQIGKIRLHWENAAATKYSLSLSADGKTWNGMHAYLKTDAKPEARVDEIKLNNASAMFIKLDLTSRANPEWGFSLYEIEVVPAE